MKIAAAMLLFFASAVSAHADWQNTKWGMRLDQVLKIVPQSRLTTTDEQKRWSRRMPEAVGPLVVAPHRAQDIDFLAMFYFVNDRLTLVGMEFQRGDRDILLSRLRARYGDPIESSRAANALVVTWRSVEENLRITYVALGGATGTVTLTYVPAGDPPGKGL